MQIAVRVEHSFIAGAKPSIHKSASVGFRIVFISAKHVGSLNGNLAALVSAEVIAVLVHDADAKPCAYADRTGLSMPRRQRIRGHLVGRFGHPVSFDDGHAEEPFDLVNETWRKGSAAGTNEAQRSSFRGFVVSTSQQKLMHLGYSRIPGHAVFVNRSPKRKCVELGGNNHGPAGKQSRHE